MAGDADRRIGRLRQGDHLCLIYDTPAEKLAALVPFLRTGLAKGERSLFLGGVPSCRAIERTLEAGGSGGIPVGREIERGALVLLSDRESWLDRGRFDPNSFQDLLRRAEQQALDDGFSGLRATWDVSWLLDGAPGAERWIEFEAGLNAFLAGSRTVAICRYPRSRSSAPLLEDVLRTHPLALIGHQVCPNAFYEPPDMVLGNGTQDERVDWMIAQVRQARMNEEKLEDLSLRLAQKGAALERADRAKEEFLTMLAHELRNPLSTISNAIQVLRIKGEGDETWHRAIDAAERQVLHQALLVDDLLEASRVTRGEVELHCESLDLAELVRETVEGYRETLRNARLEVDLDLPVETPDETLPVQGDRLRLSQALSNLLHNACKFTPPGGRVGVRARRADHGNRVELSVRDSGQGIAPDLLPHIFEVFTQADRSLDRARGGLGVGLAVVKGLVEMHGGEARAASEGLGLGSEFTLLLPLDHNATLPVHPEQEAPVLADAGGSHRRILVVEDNQDAAETLRDFLELSGHEVELAKSGTDGVEAARHFHPEVVLCDLGLPGMDGFQVAAALRGDPETANAKLIAVTGYGREEDRRKSKEAGFDLHLTKPVDPVQLRRVLQPEPARPAPSPEPPADRLKTA